MVRNQEQGVGYDAIDSFFLGLAGYVAILLAWTAAQMKREPISSYAALSVLAMIAFGLLFSIYLTFLEPFVIGAACAWCLTSAILMTVLFGLSLKPGRLACSMVFMLGAE